MLNFLKLFYNAGAFMPVVRVAAGLWYAPLVALLARIEANDTNYDVRNPLVVEAVALAMRFGLKAGFRIDTQDPEWPVAYIELPTGQVSWYLLVHPVPFDGHTTAEKYARIGQLAEFAFLKPAGELTPAVEPATHEA